jgi:hypothetical protein
VAYAPRAPPTATLSKGRRWWYVMATDDGERGNAFDNSTVTSTTKNTKVTKMQFDELSNRVIGCAIEVHRVLGPGLLESTYEQCLARELTIVGLGFKLQ